MKVKPVPMDAIAALRLMKKHAVELGITPDDGVEVKEGLQNLISVYCACKRSGTTDLDVVEFLNSEEGADAYEALYADEAEPDPTE